MLPSERAFYRRWIIANGWSEAAGLGTTFVLGRLVAPVLDREAGVVVVLAGALVAVVLGTLLEGILVGVAQEAVLRPQVARLPRRHWVIATALGAGLAWTLGMLPSTVLALGGTEASSSAAAEPSAAVQYALAGALGMISGPILGVAQWWVLRRLVHRAGRWLGANALAWAIGMPLIFFGMDRVPWTGSPAAVGLAVYAVCGATGLLVGAVHGRVLVRLVKAPIQA